MNAKIKVLRLGIYMHDERREGPSLMHAMVFVSKKKS